MEITLDLPADPPLEPRPRAVVIGASSGIGAAVAHRLTREGYLVALLARREQALRDVCDHINAEAGERRAFPIVHDVTAYEEIPALFQALLRELKGINLIVYAAGVMPSVAPAEFNFEKDRLMLEVNLMGAVAWLGQAATLFERLEGGHIVGISSVAGDRGRVLNPAYSASKAGLDAYLESLRNRLTRRGVKVLTVIPGQVKTAMLESAQRTLWVGSPDQAAGDIWRAIRTGKQLIYTRAGWRWIMFVVRNLPSVIFRRLSF